MAAGNGGGVLFLELFPVSRVSFINVRRQLAMCRVWGRGGGVGCDLSAA